MQYLFHLAGDLDVLPGGHDERPDGRAGDGDVRVAVRAGVALLVEGNTEKAESIRGAGPDLRGVLADAARAAIRSDPPKRLRS